MKVLKYLLKIFSYVFSYRMYYILKKLINKLYSYWILTNFKSISDTVLICRPFKLVGGEYISIGEHVGFGERGTLTAWKTEIIPQILIGNFTNIGDGFHITAVNEIIIGNGVLIGKHVTITDNSHGAVNGDELLTNPIERKLFSKGAVIIKDRVWIGDKVTILPKVIIGENSIIGANALVTKDIPANCIAAGVPAKVIKYIN